MTKPTGLTRDELDFIRDAAAFLENPGPFIRLANSLGAPLEALQARLPERAAQAVEKAARLSIQKALDTALQTVQPTVPERSFRSSDMEASNSGAQHLAATAITGALGGVFGIASLPIELPITTGLMLRSIARIAAEFGADLNDPGTRLELLYIFALGTPSPKDDAGDTAYYASRVGFSQLLNSAASYLTTSSIRQILAAMQGGSAPVLARLVAAIASRFQVTVTQKALAGAIPVIGAAGGALINSAFTSHFNQAARYHFGMRKLEREHGQETIQRIYEDRLKGAEVIPISRAKHEDG